MTTIALPRGELAAETEKFLRQYECPVQLTGKVPLAQKYGEVTYRLVRPRDVARFVGPMYDLGITGKDLVKDVGSSVKIVEELPFGIGKVVIYRKKTTGSDAYTARCVRYSNEPPDPKKVVTSDYPGKIAKMALAERLEGKLFQVDGSDEGYVSNGEADYGIGCVFSGETMKLNDVEIADEIMDTCAVIIAPLWETFAKEKFYRAITGKILI